MTEKLRTPITLADTMNYLNNRYELESKLMNGASKYIADNAKNIQDELPEKEKIDNNEFLQNLDYSSKVPDIPLEDPDSTLEAIDFYNNMFGYYDSDKFDGETMNSFMTTLDVAIKSMEEYQHLKNNNIYLSTDKDKQEKLLALVLGSESVSDEMKENFCKFYYLYHTKANFSPVPNGFNQGRVSKTNDYWDLTLLWIYNYYQPKEAINRTEVKDYIVEFKGNNAIANTIEWLDHFGSWNKFVEANFMQPFVEVISEGEDGKEGVYGQPKELFTGHFEKDHKLPKDDAEINEFLKNATARIIARGERMLQKLNKDNSKSNS